MVAAADRGTRTAVAMGLHMEVIPTVASLRGAAMAEVEADHIRDSERASYCMYSSIAMYLLARYEWDLQHVPRPMAGPRISSPPRLRSRITGIVETETVATLPAGLFGNKP